MPGIVGIVAPQGKDNLDASLESMVQPMLRHDWFTIEKKVVYPAGLASVSLNDENPISVQGPVYLTLDGEIFDQDELRVKLSNNGDKKAYQYCFSDVLLQLYLHCGIESLCGLNGLYVITIWDADRKKLTIVNDRYGLGRLYYWLSKDRFMFASEIKSISWHSEFNKKICELALANLLWYDIFLDDRTFFEDIKLLPPACITTYQNGELTFEQYWDFEFFDPNGEILTEDEYIDEYYYRTCEAVRKRARDNACLLLTEGLDSRIIAGALHKSAGGLNIRANTIGHEHSWDVQRGREIAKIFGFDHTYLPISPSYLADYADEFVWVSDGNVNCHNSWIFAERSYLKNNDVSHIMTGHFGNLLRGDYWVDELLEEGATEELALTSMYPQPGNKTSLRARLLKPNTYNNIEWESYKSRRSSFNEANTQNILNKVEYMIIRQDVRRQHTGREVLGDYVRVLDAYFDNDLVDFCLKLPPELKAMDNIQRKMVVKYMPEVARIRNESSILNVKSKLIVQNNRYLKFLFSIPKRLRRRSNIFRRKGIGDKPSSCILYNSWLNTYSRGYVLSVLDQREFLEDYFDLDLLNQIVQDQMEGKRREARLISAIITFSLWRQKFCQ